jgi:hypothetical protein
VHWFSRDFARGVHPLPLQNPPKATGLSGMRRMI